MVVVVVPSGDAAVTAGGLKRRKVHSRRRRLRGRARVCLFLLGRHRSLLQQMEVVVQNVADESGRLITEVLPAHGAHLPPTHLWKIASIFFYFRPWLIVNSCTILLQYCLKGSDLS